MNPSDDYLRALDEITAPSPPAYALLDAMPDELPAVKYPRAPGHRRTARRTSWRLVRQDLDQGQAGRQARRPARRAQGQFCLAGVPMMIGADVFEGYVPDVDATIVDASSTPAAKSPARRCANFLRLWRQPHQFDRPGAQSAQTGLHHRRLVVRQRRAGRRRRCRHGDRRRPGRLDPHPGEFLAASSGSNRPSALFPTPASRRSKSRSTLAGR